MTSLVESFNQCRTPADFYRLEIPFERTATPVEFADLWNQRHLLPPDALTWLESVWRIMFFEPTQLQRYHRKRLSEYVWLYSGFDSERADRDLVIAFAGKSQRVFLPIAVWLQYMLDSSIDLVLLQDPLLGFFSEGIPGYGATLYKVLAKLDVDVNLRGYRRILGLGGSAGGAAALRAGLILRAANAVSMGGRVPTRGDGSNPPPDGALDELKELTRANRTGTRLFCAFGAKYQPDRTAAVSLARASSATLVPLEGVEGHNVPFSLLKQKRLRGFLNQFLFSG